LERLPRPCALAGTDAEALCAVGCGIGLAIVFAAEIFTPDTVVGAVSLFPVVTACWLLSSRVALSLWAVCGAVFTLAIAVEPAGRATLVLVGIPTLVSGLLVRAYAVSLSRALPPAGSSQIEHPQPLQLWFTDPLTRREREVVWLAAQAYTAPEIGRQLHIGERTVESHLASAYAKLGINSKPELIRLASRTGPL
jgi:DNA-binding CsgD family transcriptional regulator